MEYLVERRKLRVDGDKDTKTRIKSFIDSDAYGTFATMHIDGVLIKAYYMIAGSEIMISSINRAADMMNITETMSESNVSYIKRRIAARSVLI